MILETDRLFLQSPNETDPDAVCAYYRANWSFLKSFEPPRPADFFTPEGQRILLDGQIRSWAEDRAYRFCLLVKDSREVVGSAALNEVVRGPFQSCFLGYQLDAAHRGQGLMPEAVRRIVRFAFEELDLHRIEGNVMPRNRASIAVLEKCGFACEGLSRKYLNINGVWEDHLHYVRLNEATADK